MRNKMKFTAILALLALLLSGCAADTEPLSAVSLPDSSVSSERSAESDGSVESAESAETVEIPGDSGEVSSGGKITSDSAEKTGQSGGSAEESAEQPGVSAEPDSAESQEHQAVTTAPATSAPVTAATTTAATTAATEPPAPVKVVIPEVRVPLSPGKDTASNDKVLVDYSNSSEGYISVRWNETGKRVKLRIICGDKTYDHDVSGGGAVEYFPVSCGSGTYKVQIYEQTEGDKYAKSLETEFTVKLRSETAPFLYPNKYVYFAQDSSTVRKAAELCAGKTDEIEKLAAIFGWVTDNVTYDTQLAATVKSGYVPDPDSVLRKKSGICYDYASLVAAMARSQSIPTRLVIGYAADNIYHAWNEVWTDETGWITPELLLSKKGYNIVDATFYAGSSNKEKIAAYIQNSGNYAALYYY